MMLPQIHSNAASMSHNQDTFATLLFASTQTGSKMPTSRSDTLAKANGYGAMQSRLIPDVRQTSVFFGVSDTMLAKRGNSTTAVASSVGTTEDEADRKWKEAFANTTSEQWAMLEEMFMEEEEKYGTMPLDFTGK